MYALLDCDNFFVSCERLFHPELKARPVVVLSNNDGCVVSRSYEAKAIGIPMGAPYFKVEALLKSHQGTACSSNFGLYSDISRRIMQIIKSKHPELEIYSIDEAFIKMPAEQSLEEAMELRNMLLQNTGISVSIGIAPTKTLCKTAGSVAKKKIKDKIHFLNIPNETDALLSRQDVGEIWGIGKNLKSKLNFLGIFTALELKNTPLRLIKENFGLSLEKIVLELNNCPVLNNIHEENQSLMCTGSFEKEIFQKEGRKLSVGYPCAISTDKTNDNKTDADKINSDKGYVEKIPVYENQAVEIEKTELEDYMEWDAVLFTCASSAKRIAYMFNGKLPKTLVVSIGKKCSETLRDLGAEIIIEAAQAGYENMVEALLIEATV